MRTTVPDTGNTRGIFAGISLAPGSEARRPQIDLPTQDIEALRRLATRRRHLQELMERTEGNAAWAGQVATMIDGLSADDAGGLLAQLADGYRSTGRLDLAADTYFLLARRYPDHPLVGESLQWLIQFYASSEMAQRVQTRATTNVRGGSAVAAPNPSASDVRQASAVAPIRSGAPPTGGLTRDDRLHRAEQLADYLKADRPALYAEPCVRFAETAAQRQLGFANPALRYFLTLRALPESNPWRQCAATEEWLAQPADQPPIKKLATCRRTTEPPILDGKLDEPFWTKADRLFLRKGVKKLPLPLGEGRGEGASPHKIAAEIQLAYDAKFLYLAVHCQRSPNLDYSTDDTPRTHDADLTQHDRVTLRLDTDRDYSTAFELTVDNRGWTDDSCWDDSTWNPTWYVAAASDEQSWTIEAAIPLTELVNKPPTSRAVWAVSAQRTIPRLGYQSWAGTPSSSNTPDQYGLLIFQ